MMKAFLLSSLLFIITSNAFLHQLPSRKNGAVLMMAARGEGEMDRKQMIQGMGGIASLLLLTLGGLQGTTLPAQATVAFDPDRYGDKELKIATVNKLKQKIRNAISSDLSLAVPFLRLAVNDAIGYDSATQDGGPDGSVLFELDRPGNADLKPAFTALNKIKMEVQKTNEITLADIVAFAGATAIEAVGGPRISVQLGRYDAKDANKANTQAEGYAWENLKGAGIKEAFEKAGLGAREAVLVFGAMGAINLAVKDATNKGGDDEEDDADSIDEEPFIPTTFGRQKDIYGAQIGSKGFDTTYLAKIYKGESTGLTNIDRALIEEPGLKSFVQKYHNNNNAFLKDLTECYQKLTTLGFSGTTRNS